MYHIHNFLNICQHILKSQNRFIHHVHTYVKKSILPQCKMHAGLVWQL